MIGREVGGALEMLRCLRELGYVAQGHAEVVKKVDVVWPVAQEQLQQRDRPAVILALELADDLFERVRGLSVRGPADLNLACIHLDPVPASEAIELALEIGPHTLAEGCRRPVAGVRGK